MPDFIPSGVEGSYVFVTVEEARGGAKILFSALIVRPEWQFFAEFEVEKCLEIDLLQSYPTF